MHIPGQKLALCWAVYFQYFFVAPQPGEGVTVFILPLKMWKLRLRETKQFAQSHTVQKWRVGIEPESPGYWLHLNQGSLLPFCVSLFVWFDTCSHISIILNWGYNNSLSEIRELAKLWFMEGFSNFRISGDLGIQLSRMSQLCCRTSQGK